MSDLFCKISSKKSLLFIFILFSTILSLMTSWKSWSNSPHASIFSLSNLIGPATYSLTHHSAMLVRTDAMGTPGQPIDFYAARMPVPVIALSLLAEITHNTTQSEISSLKAVIFLIPIWLVAWNLLRRSRNLPPPILVLAAFTPFLMAPFLADVVNPQVEEGYAYGFVALAFVYCAVLISNQPASKESSWADWIILSCALVLIYLTKSSFLPLCGLIALLSIILGGGALSKRATPLLALLVAVGGWAAYVYVYTGHASVGTSLDGINFHKGNNLHFLDRYPPAPGQALDQFDSELNAGRFFKSEWSFDAYHKSEAIKFIFNYPLIFLEGVGRKLFEFFLSIEKIGSTKSTGLRGVWETLSLVVFRIANIGAMAGSAALICAPTAFPLKKLCALYLVTCMAIAAPYVIGFCYTRHVSVLIMPTLLTIAILADHIDWRAAIALKFKAGAGATRP